MRTSTDDESHLPTKHRAWPRREFLDERSPVSKARLAVV